MRILITGSAGFLGRHLIPKLQNLGHFVLGVDLVEENHSDQFIDWDLTQAISSAEIPSFDLCIHMASSAGGILVNVSDTAMIDREAKMFSHLKDIMHSKGCRRIIFTSSMNIFENAEEIVEGRATSVRPQSPYAISKLYLEREIEKNFQAFSILRSTNYFGADQSRPRKKFGESHVIPDLIEKILSQKEVEVFGDGTQIRNFIHVSDVAELIAEAVEKPKHSYFHLRSDIFVSIGELAEILMRIIGLNKPIRYQTEFMRYEPRAITAFKTQNAFDLNWRPRVQSLEEGLRLLRTQASDKTPRPIAKNKLAYEALIGAALF